MDDEIKLVLDRDLPAALRELEEVLLADAHGIAVYGPGQRGEPAAVIVHVGDTSVLLPLRTRQPGRDMAMAGHSALSNAEAAIAEQLAKVPAATRAAEALGAALDLLHIGKAELFKEHFLADIAHDQLDAISRLAPLIAKERVDLGFEDTSASSPPLIVLTLCVRVREQLESFPVPFVVVPRGSALCTTCGRELSTTTWSYAATNRDFTEACFSCFECTNSTRARGIARILFLMTPYDNPHLLELFPGSTSQMLRARFHARFEDVVAALHTSLGLSTLTRKEAPARREIPVRLRELDEYAHELVEVAFTALDATPQKLTRFFRPRVRALDRKRGKREEGT